MTQAQAVAAANDLRVALLDNGVQRVSLELMQGASSSGWGVAPFKRGLGHHIVSQPPGTPGLALVKNGRPDLAGPLCNGYGGYDLTARLITMAWANHPGLGGPWSVPGWGTVPQDNGRPYIFGWEFEGGIVEWTDEMHDFMARCGAGTLDWLGTLPGNPGPAPLECWGEHKTWAPGRKIDRLNYTTASGRARIAAVRGSTTPNGTEENEPMIVIIKPGESAVIPLPRAAAGRERYVRFGVDEPGGGTNIRVAVGWGQGQWHPLPEMYHVDGYTGWVFNGAGNDFALSDVDEVLSVRNLGHEAPLGVTVQLA